MLLVCYLHATCMLLACYSHPYSHATGRREWAEVFTKDVAVVEEIMIVMPIQNSFLILDAVQGVVSGVIRGCKWWGERGER